MRTTNVGLNMVSQTYKGLVCALKISFSTKHCKLIPNPGRLAVQLAGQVLHHVPKLRLLQPVPGDSELCCT